MALSDCSGRHILLVEGNPSNQKVALLMLKRLGYAADAVNNGLEALEALERQQYDLVLMNLKMPVMDGITATREIRTRWGKSQPVIVAVTAYILPNGEEICIEAGMDGYVTKPLRLSELEDVLNRYLSPLLVSNNSCTRSD